MYEHVNELAAGGLTDAARVANAVKRWPSVIVMYFPGVDQIGHEEGSDSHHYGEAMRDLDVQVGRILNFLQQANVDLQTYSVLVTDHSHVPTHGSRQVDLLSWFKHHRKLKIHSARIMGDDYADRLRELDGDDAVLVDGSYRRVVLYLRGAEGWFKSATRKEILDVLRIDQPEQKMWEVPGIGLVCIRDGENRVEIFSSRGEAVAERRKESDDSVSYRLETVAHGTGVGDPLWYQESESVRKFMSAGWHSSRDWLAATAETKYPDFVPQIVEYFDSRRSGDILVFSDEGWFFAGCEKGEHGSALSRDMHIPMFFSGPDLPKGGRISYARLVDVMPTMVDLLGESERLKEIPPIDGRSLAAQLRSAKVASPP
ncbi:MAG TPA: alkaline phosphatase family protein, partial [Phycisphaerae bacterium]|nr:alkaline phosphatase family protein [Phycisphaerae bacterium]